MNSNQTTQAEPWTMWECTINNTLWMSHGPCAAACNLKHEQWEESHDMLTRLSCSPYAEFWTIWVSHHEQCSKVSHWQCWVPHEQQIANVPWTMSLNGYSACAEPWTELIWAAVHKLNHEQCECPLNTEPKHLECPMNNVTHLGCSTYHEKCGVENLTTMWSVPRIPNHEQCGVSHEHWTMNNVERPMDTEPWTMECLMDTESWTIWSVPWTLSHEQCGVSHKHWTMNIVVSHEHRTMHNVAFLGTLNHEHCRVSHEYRTMHNVECPRNTEPWTLSSVPWTPNHAQCVSSITSNVEYKQRGVSHEQSSLIWAAAHKLKYEQCECPTINNLNSYGLQHVSFKQFSTKDHFTRRMCWLFILRRSCSWACDNEH
jgi:hypothetical protein